MNGQSFQQFADPGAYLNATRRAYLRREAELSLPYGIVLRAIKQPPPESGEGYFFGLAAQEGRPVLGFCQTPGRNLLLSQFRTNLKIDLEDTVRCLASLGIQPPGIGGAAPLVDQFALLWGNTSGERIRLHRRERIYRLTEVVPPPATPGFLRPAEEVDWPVILEWGKAFSQEALGQPADETFEEWLRGRAAQKDIFVWVNRFIVSMCMRTRPTDHGISVSLVYTPPENRRKGYASVMVAALSLRLIRSGYQFVSLFTDLSNPISNHIYQSIGFHPVGDWTEYQIERGQV